MKKPLWHQSLGFKLAASFLLGVGFVFLLLFSAERTLNQALRDTQLMLEGQLRPLAQVNGLQGHLMLIRDQEVELRHTQDHFALLAQVDHYQQITQSFTERLEDFLPVLTASQAGQLRQRQLQQSWQSYLEASTHLVEAAEAGDHQRLLDVSVYQSSESFQNLARSFQLFAEEQQQAADRLYNQILSQKDQRFKLFILASAIALVFLGSLLALFILHLLRRILVLRNGALQLAVDPKAQLLPVKGRDELAQLTQAFNDMFTQVHEREEALRRANEGLEMRVSERTHELRESNAELEQFAYVASHDLRQPLRMINSYLQLLDRRLGPELDDDKRKMMDFAREGAQRLDQMLLSLLEYSRVGRTEQAKQDLHLHQAVAEALSFLKPQLDETSAQVGVAEGDWPRLWVNPDEMTRLFQNLIGNALKYTEPGQKPQVRVQFQAQAGQWLFWVEDQGIGIDPEQQDRLFNVFQRLHTRETYEGNGVGLAICRKIVERHGGRIWVESSGRGQGSRFCFLLPQK